MSAHTPGPWQIAGESGAIAVWASDGPPRTRIARIKNIGYPEEATHNARLIAAAPELLAALQKCAAKFREYEALHAAKPAPEKAAQNAAMAMLCEAAITKATT